MASPRLSWIYERDIDNDFIDSIGFVEFVQFVDFPGLVQLTGYAAYIDRTRTRTRTIKTQLVST